MYTYAFQNQETLKFAKFSMVENKHSCQMYIINTECNLDGASKFRILSHKRKAFERALKKFEDEKPYVDSKYNDQWRIVELVTKVNQVLD